MKTIKSKEGVHYKQQQQTQEGTPVGLHLQQTTVSFKEMIGSVLTPLKDEVGEVAQRNPCSSSSFLAETAVYLFEVIRIIPAKMPPSAAHTQCFLPNKACSFSKKLNNKIN